MSVGKDFGKESNDKDLTEGNIIHAWQQPSHYHHTGATKT
jgi:hypothetical protein